MGKFNFAQIKRNLELTKRQLPILLSKQAERHFTESFQKGGLDEHKWQEVKRRTPGTSEYKYPRKPKQSSKTRPILVGAGALRRATSNSIKKATFEEVKLAVDLPYSKIHNEGGLTGRNHSVNMPARPYMIQTETLHKMQVSLIDQTIKKIWV